MTTYDETATGLMIPFSRNGRDSSGQLAGYAVLVDVLESRLGDLERQIAEHGWERLDGSAGREFSRAALGSIVELARIMYLKNPIVQRAVEIGALYVWGQDLSHSAADESVQAVIDRFWRQNRATLTGQQASRLIEVELQVTGNLFLALFPDRITGSVRVRGVPMEEIRQIITNPDDRTEVWYYRRSWSEQPVGGGASVERTALYPDWQFRPESKQDVIADTTHGNMEVRWDSPMMHVKSGAFLHWRWGVPEVYAALDWAKAYKDQLEDDATRSRALARFAWKLVTPGGKSGVAAAKAKLGTTFGPGTAESNPPPTGGSTFIGTDGVDMSPMRVAGSTLDPNHSRPARLMAAAALGVPDYVFDSDSVRFATAASLDRPTELRFNERRQMWRDTLGDLCQWVIDRDLEAPRGLLSKTLAEDQRNIDLSWPSLLERSVTERVQAIVDAATLSGRSLAGTMPRETVARQLMMAIGIDDIDGEISKLLDEWEEQDAQREEIAQRLAKPPGDPTARDEEREAFVAALKEVREVLRERDH